MPASPGAASLLGKVGDEVAFEGETLMVDPGRRTLVVLKDRAIGVWVAAEEAPWPLLTTGQVVRVVGRIVGVRDAQRLYVDAERVVPLPPRP